MTNESSMKSNITSEILMKFQKSVIEDKVLNAFRNLYLVENIPTGDNFENFVHNRMKQIREFYDIPPEYAPIDDDECELYINGHINDVGGKYSSVNLNCFHHEHNPPMFMWIPCGTEYTHVCPNCKKIQVLRNNIIF